MKCIECGLVLPHYKAPNLTHCTMCGEELQPDVVDILEHRKYGIVTETRPTQVKLAMDVEDTLAQERGTLLAEGGTGIGKSFAYCIPALLQKGKRIIIATAKKALQDQLYEKDIPLLVNKMGLKTTYTVYKGKSNYGCWKLIKEVPLEDREKYKKFIDKAKISKRPADIALWEGKEPSWWHKISADNCVLGRTCPHHEHCRPQPKSSQVVITNHSLMALDLQIAPGSLLGPYDILIVDEAHQAPDALRKAWSVSVTEQGLKTTKSLIDNNMAVKELIDASGVIPSKNIVVGLELIQQKFGELHRMAKKIAQDSGIYDPTKVAQKMLELRQEADTAAMHLFNISEEITRATNSGNLSASDYNEEELLGLQSKIVKVHGRVTKVGTFVSNTINGDPTVAATENSTFISVCDLQGLHLQPLDIGKLVSPRIKGVNHKIFVSATLSVDNKFKYIKKLLGISDEEHISSQIYRSPFNLKKQAAMYLPPHTLRPAYAGTGAEREAWTQNMSDEIIRLTRASKGDAFVLFTARSDMTEIAALCKGKVPNLIVQDREYGQTLNQYMSTDNSTLFGLKTFWEGVDVPGDKLKLVIIPKLPFPHPKDPIIDGLSKTCTGNSFMDVFVPKMLWDMKQGAGRLIRKNTDKGIVAILDPRIWSGTSAATTHAKRMSQIKYGTNKRQMGYGKQVIVTLGYEDRIIDDFTVCEKFLHKFFPETKK